MRNTVFIFALAAGASYYLSRWLIVPPDLLVVWKGAGVALLALWAGLHARSLDGWLITAALALGALGDVLLETHGLAVGAIAFLAGHLVAVGLYLRNRAVPLWHALLIAVAVVAVSWLLPVEREAATGVAVYAAALGLMAGTARTSRFPRYKVALGAMLFVLSDLLIFGDGGAFDAKVAGLLIWPTYFIGQALIAHGVVTTLEREKA